MAEKAHTPRGIRLGTLMAMLLCHPFSRLRTPRHLLLALLALLSLPLATASVQDPTSAQNSTVAQTSAPNDYDVIVVGSEPEGITAAVAAAQEGARTLLVSEDARVGGLFVLGQMNSLDLRTRPTLYQQGLFLAWWERVGRGGSFDVREAEDAFVEMLGEAGVALRLNTAAEPVFRDAEGAIDGGAARLGPNPIGGSRPQDTSPQDTSVTFAPDVARTDATRTALGVRMDAEGGARVPSH